MKNLLKQIIQLEEKANRFLESIGDFFLKKVIPITLQNKMKRAYQKLVHFFQLLLQKTKFFFIKSFQSGKKLKTKITNYTDIAFKYPYQEKLNLLKQKFLAALKHLTFKDFKYAFKLSFFHSKNYLKKLNWKYVSLYFSLTVVVILSGITIVQTILTILEKEGAIGRKIASEQTYIYRPSYTTYTKRSFPTFNVKVPLFSPSLKSISVITVDFSTRTTTRFAKKFLEANEHKIKDYFFTETSPVISDFPLEDEGKELIKEKIQEELNLLLERENVEGYVEEVNLLYMIAS